MHKLKGKGAQKRSTPPKSDLLDLSSDNDVQIRRCDLPEKLDVKTDAEPAPNQECRQFFSMFQNKVPDTLLERLNSETELVMQSDNRDVKHCRAMLLYSLRSMIHSTPI